MVSIPQGGGKGGSAPPQNSELCNSFKIWNWRVKKNIKILVLLFFPPSFVWIWRDKVILVRLLEVILKNPRSQLFWIYRSNLARLYKATRGGGVKTNFLRLAHISPLPRIISVYALVSIFILCLNIGCPPRPRNMTVE